MRLTLPSLLALSTLAGCGSGPADNPTGPAPAQARVVVAVVDSAFNPYHEFFYAGSAIYADAAPSSVTPAVLAELGVAPEDQVTLTRSGTLADDVAADASFWSRVQRGRPYWFRGTNLVAISVCEEPLPPLVPHPDKSAHGTGTSASVLRANPEAVLLLVEACAIGIADASEQAPALEHPAVDLFNLSFTSDLGMPVAAYPSYGAVVQRGKLGFQSAGNVPFPTPLLGGPGHWWMIGVGGVDEQAARGQSVLAGTLPDFVAEDRASLPFCMDCESGELAVAGTSLSSPRAAGVASRVLLEARRALGHAGGIRTVGGRALMVDAGGVQISNWDLRRALEEAAYVGYDIAGYQPTVGSGLPPVDAIPVNDAAPWLQLAWGDLSPDPDKQVVPEALAQLGLGTPAGSKDAGYCQFQLATLRLRQTYWDAVDQVRGFGEVVPDPDPYRACDAAGN